MADEHIDMKPHVATYDSLIRMLTRGGIAVLVIAFFVIWLIAH